MRVLLGIVALLWGQAFARNHSNPSVRVCVRNGAGAAGNLLRDAEAECSRIFGTAGVRIDWGGDTCTRPDDLWVNIANTAAGGIKDSVLGYVSEGSTGASAFVIWPRILPLVTFERPAFEITGRVMAHELGHLLLGEEPHSAAGLMRGTWTSSDFRTDATRFFYFTGKDEARMRHEVEARASMRSDRPRTYAYTVTATQSQVPVPARQ